MSVQCHTYEVLDKGSKCTVGSIDSSKCTVGSIDSSKCIVGSIDSSKWTVGSIDSSKWTVGSIDSSLKHDMLCTAAKQQRWTGQSNSFYCSKIWLFCESFHCFDTIYESPKAIYDKAIKSHTNIRSIYIYMYICIYVCIYISI